LTDGGRRKFEEDRSMSKDNRNGKMCTTTFGGEEVIVQWNIREYGEDGRRKKRIKQLEYSMF